MSDWTLTEANKMARQIRRLVALYPNPAVRLAAYGIVSQEAFAALATNDNRAELMSDAYEAFGEWSNAA